MSRPTENQTNDLMSKPEGWAEEFARVFTDKSVAESYYTRPEYHPAVFDILRDQVNGRCERALDLGCGTGFIARNLSFVSRVDAVDFSANMIAVGKSLPATTSINWICDRAKEAPLDGPYDLVTAGESLHWMDWKELFSHLKPHAVTNAPFAILTTDYAANPWDESCRKLISRHSTNQKYKSIDMIAALEEGNLYQRIREEFTEYAPFIQSPADYTESFHARNGLSRERMSAESAEQFDHSLLALLHQHGVSDHVNLKVRCKIVLGRML